VLNIWRNNAVQNFNQYLESTTAEIDKSTLSKLSQDLPPDKRSKLSFLHARSIFTHEGRIIEYPSTEGTPVTFTPTAEDQSNRNLILFQQTQAASEKMIATTNNLAWLIALLGAFGFGFTSTIQRNNEVN
jgi:ERCC4-related helicase